MAQWTCEAVVAQCFLAFGRGVGSACDVDSEVLAEFYARLDSVFKSVELTTWEDDHGIAIAKWHEFGKRFADERPVDFDGMADLFVAVIHRAPTRYCQVAEEAFANR
jgi:hypothetical protein